MSERVKSEEDRSYFIHNLDYRMLNLCVSSLQWGIWICSLMRDALWCRSCWMIERIRGMGILAILYTIWIAVWWIHAFLVCNGESGFAAWRGMQFTGRFTLRALQQARCYSKWRRTIRRYSSSSCTSPGNPQFQLSTIWGLQDSNLLSLQSAFD